MPRPLEPWRVTLTVPEAVRDCARRASRDVSSSAGHVPTARGNKVGAEEKDVGSQE